MKSFSLLSLLLSFVAGTVPSCEGDGANTVRCFEETLTREVYDQEFQQVDSAERLTELVKSLLNDRITKLNHPPANEAAEYAAIHDPEYVAYMKHYYAEAILPMLSYCAEYAAIRIKDKTFEETKDETLVEANFNENMKKVNALVDEFKGKIQQIYDGQKRNAEVISASPEPTNIPEPSASSEDNEEGKLNTEENIDDETEREEIIENNGEIKVNESDYESEEEIIENKDEFEEDGSDYESDEDSLDEIFNESDDTVYDNKS